MFIVCSAELRLLTGEISAAKGKLNNVQDMATQSLNMSTVAYDNALEIYAHVDRTVIPKIDTKKIRFDADVIQTSVSNKQFVLQQFAQKILQIFFV